jgi:5-methylcytosine-specific restriction endonuclease McrA
MKKCQSCNNLVKNSYTQCYECNSKATKYDSGSEPELTPYKKETIPKTVRNCLWINYFKDSREGKCCCCKRETISIGNFHAGHIIAESNGGKTSLDNMRPICMLCNISMQRTNMDDFITRYNLLHGL